MLLVLIAKCFFAGITHKFPVKGHTFLNCDRDFAIIEKAKKCEATDSKRPYRTYYKYWQEEPIFGSG